MTLSHSSTVANDRARAETTCAEAPAWSSPMETGTASAANTIGLQPWFPWPLSRWRWWSRPVRAERLAALRIGLSACLLFDLFTSYLPHLADFYGQGSLSEPPLYRFLWKEHKWNWSLLHGVQDQTYHTIAMIVWIVAVVGLLTGCFTRVSAVIAWVLSMSFANLNSDIDNAGDTVRGILLFYLAISPCGATWSIDAWRSKRTGPAFIFPWPLRLIFLQMIVIYWANGLHKVVGREWQLGNSLYFVLSDATLTRVSRVEFGLPYWLTRVMSWTVLGWEVTFPLLLVWRPIRIFALCLGVLFHLGIWFSLELGMFAPYMLCMYLPLLPWEKLPHVTFSIRGFSTATKSL
jgi:hypothetical protein